eukprot:CAMPEP_0184739116 /NCGR_PEP_ID=MMETSP0315-20130426/1926_1 /TAXON_ID=101924 /ORGANISM="Rhodosorus marinus, Strain UTEX LB 2760" /LENGTH=245 /DNA_ID=CAMNT_0027207561 /DNA_START=268 /DNA_END=1005 /DNA_ORIENTATION=-
MRAFVGFWGICLVLIGVSGAALDVVVRQESPSESASPTPTEFPIDCGMTMQAPEIPEVSVGVAFETQFKGEVSTCDAYDSGIDAAVKGVLVTNSGLSQWTTVISRQTESDGLELGYVGIASALQVQNFVPGSTFANYLDSEEWVNDLNDAGVNVTSADTSDIVLEAGEPAPVSAGVIAGSIIGGILLLVIIGLNMMWYWRNREERKAREEDEKIQQLYEDPQGGSSSGSLNAHTPPDIEGEEFED